MSDAKPFASKFELIDAAIKVAGSREALIAATSMLLDGGEDLASMRDLAIKLGAIMCWDKAHAREHRTRSAAYIESFFDATYASMIPAPKPQAHQDNTPLQDRQPTNVRALADAAYRKSVDDMNSWRTPLEAA